MERDGTGPVIEEDLTKSGHVNVRWQAQMEEHLKHVRELARSAQGGMRNDAALAYATAAQAHGLAAIALAIANTVGDLEMPLSNLADAVHLMGD